MHTQRIVMKGITLRAAHRNHRINNIYLMMADPHPHIHDMSVQEATDFLASLNYKRAAKMTPQQLQTKINWLTSRMIDGSIMRVFFHVEGAPRPMFVSSCASPKEMAEWWFEYERLMKAWEAVHPDLLKFRQRQ